MSFASIAKTTKNNIKYSHKLFSDYLKDECDSTVFLQPTSKEEIVNICDALHDLGSVTIWCLHGCWNVCKYMLMLFSTFMSFLSICMS